MSLEGDKGKDSIEQGLTVAGAEVESSDEEITTKQCIDDSAKELVPNESKEIPSPSQESAAGSWWATGSTSWSGWYESALNKSSAAYDLMKKDLSEFKDTIANESVNYVNSTSNIVSSTVQVVSSTANYLKETVESLVDEEEEDKNSQKGGGTDNDGDMDDKERTSLKEQEQFNYPESLTIAAADKLTSVFNSLIESLLPTGPDDDPDEDCVLLPGNYLVPKSRWDQLVQSIQSDPITYCHEPSGPPDDYESWLEKFNLMDHESSITYLLENSPTVSDFYAQFVPKSLSSDEFWHRYFYRLHQLQEMEIQRAKLLYEQNAVRKQEPDDESKTGKSADEKVDTEKLMEEPTMKKSNVQANPVSEPHSNTSSKDSSPKKISTVVAEKVPSSAPCVKSVSSIKSAKSGKSNKSKVTKVPGKTPSPASSESTAKSSSEGSEWEKTDLNEIVDEVAKKLGDKLNSMPEPTSDDGELDQWEFE